MKGLKRKVQKSRWRFRATKKRKNNSVNHHQKYSEIAAFSRAGTRVRLSSLTVAENQSVGLESLTYKSDGPSPANQLRFNLLQRSHDARSQNTLTTFLN